MFNKQKEKYYENKNEELNKELLDLKFQYEAMMDTLRSKQRDADDLLRQLTSMMAYIKKRYKKELEGYKEKKNGE